MTSLTSRLACLLLLGSVACKSTTTPSDAGDASTGTDAPMMDAALPPTASGVTMSMCSAAMDLNTTGTLAGDTITVHGSTAMPAGIMAGPCNPALTGHQVYTYTVRGDGVTLRATTGIEGGTPELDTTIWFLAAPCSENAMVIGCNDDDSNVPDDLAGASTLYAGPFARGTQLVLVVASYALAHRGAAARGDFVLGVTEMPAAAAGATCDATIVGGCVSGDECAANSVMNGVCVAPSSETEPNDTPTTANALGMVTGPLAVHAAIMPAGDVDCFGFSVAAGTSLWIEASDGAGSCGADLRADLYQAGMSDPIDGDDDSGRASDVACPRLDPSGNTGVRNMAAGSYVLCVKASEPSGVPPMITLAHYSMQIAIVPTPPGDDAGAGSDASTGDDAGASSDGG